MTNTGSQLSHNIDTSQNPAQRWQELAGGGTATHVIPTDHGGMITQPGVQTLGGGVESEY